jgi:hypothetical protein
VLSLRARLGLAHDGLERLERRMTKNRRLEGNLKYQTLGIGHSGFSYPQDMDTRRICQVEVCEVAENASAKADINLYLTRD